jgi:hypothetical protein
MSEAMLVAFGAAEPVVRGVRAKIARGRMAADGFVDALNEVDAILEIVPLTADERLAVRAAMASLIDQQRALVSEPQPTT